MPEIARSPLFPYTTVRFVNLTWERWERGNSPAVAGFLAAPQWEQRGNTREQAVDRQHPHRLVRPLCIGKEAQNIGLMPLMERSL